VDFESVEFVAAGGGALLQQGHEVRHEREFGIAAGFPRQAEGFQQFGELLTVEDHALKNIVHEGLEPVGGQAVLLRDGGEFGGVALVSEAAVAGFDFLLIDALKEVSVLPLPVVCQM